MLIVTLGDPLSINVELVCRSHAQLHQVAESVPVVFVGSILQWQDQTQRLGRKIVVRVIEKFADVIVPGIYFLNSDAQVGLGSSPRAENLTAKERSEIAASALRAVESIKGLGKKSAVLTLGVDKNIVSLSIPGFSGQTEFFAKMFDAPAIMILAGQKLRVGLVTNHLRLSEVSQKITKDLVVQKIRLFQQSLRDLFGYRTPSIAVCGLNPHAGDSGLFGDEESLVIMPAVDLIASEKGMLGKVVGPVSADTAFFRCMQGEFDGVLAMYHDQGLGPLKTVHFWDAINVSGGLPVLRVSVDHGPASDLFLKNKANPQSFIKAMEFAHTYLTRV
jgi:4-hydroxythreonine-4-phosphate dehydrogenase